MGDETSAVRRSARVRKPRASLQEQEPSPVRTPAKRARRTSSSRTVRKAKEVTATKPKRAAQEDRPVTGNIANGTKPVSPSDLSAAPVENGESEFEAGPPRPWGAVEDSRVLKLVTWNVASARSLVKAGALHPYITREEPDVLCLQETKMTPVAEEEFPAVEGYVVHWNHSEKKGYSGVAVLIREDLAERKDGLRVTEVRRGMGLEEADFEGRVLSCYFNNGLVVVNAYVPNSGGKLARLGFRTKAFEPAMRNFLNGLAEKYSVVYCGDLNVAHMPIDIHNSKGNQKSAGHTPEERQEFSNFLESGSGWKDSFRQIYPDAHGYTYFSRRFGPRLKSEGKGWRLDYHVLDLATFNRGAIGDIYVRTDVEGSDHYPLILEYKL